MAAKKHSVGNGIEIQFDQIAAGQETPYYVGNIYQNGEKIGYFSNDGNGGATIINPPKAERALEQMVDEAAKKLGYDTSKLDERAAEVIDFGAAVRKVGKKMTLPVEREWMGWIQAMVKSHEEFAPIPKIK